MCKSISKLRKHEGTSKKLLAHVEIAQDFRLTFNNRRIFKLPLSQSQERSTFKPSLGKLDEVLSNIYKYKEDDIVGYKLDTEIYQELSSELIKLRGEAQEWLTSVDHKYGSLALPKPIPLLWQFGVLDNAKYDVE